MALSGGIRESYCVFVVTDHLPLHLAPPPLRVASHRTRRHASSAPVVSAIANVVGTYFDAADAKERAIVRIAYRDRFLAAAAALVAGAAVVAALVAPRLCAFAGNRPFQVTPIDAPIGTLAHCIGGVPSLGGRPMGPSPAVTRRWCPSMRTRCMPQLHSKQEKNDRHHNICTVGLICSYVMTFCDGDRVLDSTKLEHLVEYYQNFRYFWRHLYQNFRYFSVVICTRISFLMLGLFWRRQACCRAGRCSGGGGPGVDRDKPVARLELGEVAAAQAEVDHGDARCVDRAAASRTTKSAPGALLTILTSISC